MDGFGDTALLVGVCLTLLAGAVGVFAVGAAPVSRRPHATATMGARAATVGLLACVLAAAAALLL